MEVKKKTSLRLRLFQALVRSLTLEAESASHKEETSEMEKEPALLGENLWDQGVKTEPIQGPDNTSN